MIFNSSQSNVFETAKTVNIITTAQQLLSSSYELHQSGAEWRCKSISDPKHDNSVTCFYPDTNSFFEFNTNLKGDVIDFVALVKNISLLEAAKFLAGDSGYSAYHISETKSWQQELEAKYLKAHENLKNYPQIIEYLHKRGISDATIEKYKIGVYNNYDGLRITIPYFDQFGKIIYGVMRATRVEQEAKYLKEKIRDDLKKNFSQPLMFLDSLKKSKDTLIIGEGTFDIMSAVQENYAGLCFVGGHAGYGNIGVITHCAKNFNRVVLCFDNDANSKVNSGANFNIDTAHSLIRAGITNFVCIRDYGLGNKDLSDFYAAGGNIEDLIGQAQPGVIFTVENFAKTHPLTGYVSYNRVQENYAELKKFYSLLKNSLKCDDNLMKACNDIFKSYYSSTVLKGLQKEPTKNEIINEIVDAYLKDKIMFTIGQPKHKEFEIYDAKYGIFRRRNESFLYAELKEQFDVNEDIYVKATNEIFVKKFLKDEWEYPRWNTFEGFNFASNVLDYKTKKLMPHSPDFHFNFVADFDYDPKAKCPTFERFLDDLSNGSKSRLATLNDMLGYLLASHCKAQAIFALVGNGANGKSVLETVLKGIFDGRGQGFATDLNPDDLANYNQAIRLIQSVLNFNSDCIVSVCKKACANLKRASAGDSISGNKKFYDIISFLSRAKYIFGFNEQPRIADTSYGMKRRLVFIKLEKKFDENPDISLEEKLLEEKAGIFNYMLKCYEDLKARNFQIRRCEDQEEMIRNFEIAGNEVAAFLADIEEEFINSASPVITTEKLHESFVNWLDSTRNRKTSMTKNKLTSEIKRLTGLETFQITAGESRGRRAFDFSEYIEKRKKEIPEQERRAEWEKIESEMKADPENDEIVQEDYDWAAENFVKSGNINDFLACLRRELEKTKDTHDEIELYRLRNARRILEHIERRSAA